MAANLLCSPDMLFRHIGLLFGEKLDTLFTSSDSKICGFTRAHVIGFVADLFFSGFAVEFAGCVWTVAVSGKKKVRIRKYPDTCGRGLRQYYMYTSVSSYDCPCHQLIPGKAPVVVSLEWKRANTSIRRAAFLALQEK